MDGGGDVLLLRVRSLLPEPDPNRDAHLAPVHARARHRKAMPHEPAQWLTPLQLACIHSQSSVVAQLLEHDAEVARAAAQAARAQLAAQLEAQYASEANDDERRFSPTRQPTTAPPEVNTWMR